MLNKLLPLWVALVSGSAMAIQGTFNSVLGKTVGLLEASLVVHITGTVIILLLLYAFHFGQGNLGAAAAAPWYTFLGGALNVAIIYGVASSISRLGVAVTTTAIIVGQVLFAVIIDHFGLFGAERFSCSWWQLLGIAFLAVGARLLLR